MSQILQPGNLLVTVFGSIDEFDSHMFRLLERWESQRRQTEIKRAIKFSKSELEEALELSRQQVHNWYLEKIIVPINDSAIKKEFTEEAIRAGLQKLSPTKREKYEQTLNQYIERKFRITIKSKKLIWVCNSFQCC